jgi:ribosomal protein S18 acetylase RimI-like enzyme
MHQQNIIYSFNTSSVAQIQEHLMQSDGQFRWDLEQRVSILEYAEKLFLKANRFEAWIDGALTGFLAVYFNENAGIAYITNVSVLKKRQGMDIAKTLLKQLDHECIKRQFSTIELEVRLDNYKAIQLYESFGFIKQEASSQNIFMQLKINYNEDKT